MRRINGTNGAVEEPIGDDFEGSPREPSAGSDTGLAPLLLTEAQAAALLSLSPRKVWELAASGAIPSVKIGTVKRYRRIDLEEWVSRGCPTEPEK